MLRTPQIPLVTVPMGKLTRFQECHLLYKQPLNNMVGSSRMLRGFFKVKTNKNPNAAVAEVDLKNSWLNPASDRVLET